MTAAGFSGLLIARLLLGTATSIVPPTAISYLTSTVPSKHLAKSIHHARVLIKQRHIRVGKQLVNVPSFLVSVDSEKHIDFAMTSPYGNGRPGRVARKRAAAKAGDDGEEDDE